MKEKQDSPAIEAAKMAVEKKDVRTAQVILQNALVDYWETRLEEAKRRFGND